MSDSIDPPAKKGRAPLWKPGESGNPTGRPKGARSLLKEKFFTDLLADWQQHGAIALQTFREERPHDYVKVVAGVLPKELNVKVNELEDLSDAQISAQLAILVGEMRASGLDPLAGAEEPLGQEETGTIPPLH